LLPQVTLCVKPREKGIDGLHIRVAADGFQALFAESYDEPLQGGLVEVRSIGDVHGPRECHDDE
jgi:hypothetical protein